MLIDFTPSEEVAVIKENLLSVPMQAQRIPVCAQLLEDNAWFYSDDLPIDSKGYCNG
jgi:hypothetical protein